MKRLLCLLICAGFCPCSPSWLAIAAVNGNEAEMAQAPTAPQDDAAGKTKKKCKLRLNGTEFDNGDPDKVDGISFKRWYDNKEGTECTTVTVKKGYHFTIKGAYWRDGSYTDFSEVIDMDGTDGEVSRELCRGD